MSCVLDSYALLAYLNDEPASARVAQVLGGSDTLFLSTINLGETLYIVERHRGVEVATRALGQIDQLNLEQVEATRPRVLASARIKASHPLSYADAFAVSTAIEFQARILTGDREFETVANLVEIEWLP